MEPFGGPEDFDVNDVGLVYTSKDPSVNEATHTRQNVWLNASPAHLHLTNRLRSTSYHLSPMGLQNILLQGIRGQQAILPFLQMEQR